jgi:serine/threonine-protein kinase
VPPPLPAPLAPAKEGDVLGGTRYRLVREIGRGASSVVYEAEHLDLGKRAAIKILEGGGDAKPGGADLHARFRKEARTLSRLSHEGLVAVHDVGQAADGRLFCVMELLDGETLEARLARGPRPGYAEVLAVATRVLGALEVAHGAGLVHRDIKPANVFLPRAAGEGSARWDVSVKLLDFGLARSTGEQEPTTAPDRDRAGMSIFGTPEYMAPEQASSATVDARADLYALGCVMYEMLTGRLPFAGASAVAILDAKAKGSPERPRSTAPTADIPEAVDALVMKALARHPSERFQTASEMRRAVEAVVRAPSRGGRARVAAASVVAALMAVTAVVGAVKSPKGRALLARLRGPEVTAVAVVPSEVAPLEVAPPAQEPAAVAATDATQDAEGFDVGEDGDFVDDTHPPPAVDAPVVAAADPAPTPPTTPTPSAEPEKPRHKKHKGKAARKAAAAADANDAPASDPAALDPPAPKKDKRRKHKSKVAEVQ